MERQQRVDIQRPRLELLKREWSNVFNTLARIPSDSSSDMSQITGVVKDMYSGPIYEKAGVTVDILRDELRHGPMVIRIPEYNPFGVAFQPTILCGHLDVVKGTRSNPQEEGDIIKSNGPAIDNKGPVSAVIVATQAIIRNNIPHPALRIVFTTDEETDGQQIKRVPVGNETMAFIADKSGPIGTIVTGSGGYTGIEAHVTNLTGKRALEFITDFNHRMGGNLIARRRSTNSIPHNLFSDRTFSIDAISISPNNSRNTLPDNGYIRGTVYCQGKEDEQVILTQLNQLVVPLNAEVNLKQGENPLLRVFEVTLHGKAGHTSKVGTSEDDGFVSVFSDTAVISKSLLPQDTASESLAIPDQEVRINIGSMSSERRGNQTDITFAGEARYHNGEGAHLVLRNLQSLVENYGGTMRIIEENRANHLDPNTQSVQLARKILERYGYSVNVFDTGFGISDANNAPRQWNTVVLSDGSINPHRSDEAISMQSVEGLLQIFYDLATQNNNAKEVSL